MLIHKTNGEWGELLAVSLLRKKHYKIIDRNYACKFGEIDIIAANGEYLVFVEVKLRQDDSHGMAREFVTAAKQQRLRQTALIWLSKNPTELQPRFDVIEIYAPEGTATKKPVIYHLEDAFQ